MKFLRARSHATAWLRTLGCVALMGILALVPACGDDDDGGGGGGGTTTTNQEILEGGMRSFAEFGADAASMEEAALLLALSEPLLQIFPAARTVAAEILFAPTAADAARAVVSLAPRIVKNPHGLAKAGIEEEFGVYVCDPEEPFDPADTLPGWVKTEEIPNPSNSVILRFDTDCGVVYYDRQGNPKTATGEIRLLDVEVDTGDPEIPEDDIPTQFIAEIVAGPAGPNPQNQPKIMRLTWDAAIDSESRQLESLTIGSPTANTPSDPSASFIGPMLFYAGVTASLTSTTADFALYDTIHNYVVAFGAAIEGTLDVLESLSLDFGFGETNNPASPPFLFEVTGSNFREGGTQLPLADITGAIRHNGRALATFLGSTAFVAVEIDVNGDEVVDENDTCPDIDVTFTDTEDSGNICLYMDELVMLIQSLPIGITKMAMW